MGPSSTGDQPLEERILDATLRCVARWGVAKTTLDDVARDAGCGRATIYRTFSGGKASVLEAVVRREVSRLAAAVDAATEGQRTLEDVLAAGTAACARFLGGHAALRFLFAHEPDAILPHVTFDRLGPLFAEAAAMVRPRLAPFVAAAELDEAAEWAVRVVLTQVANPFAGLDLADAAAARRFVATYLVPALVPTALPARS